MAWQRSGLPTGSCSPIRSIPRRFVNTLIYLLVAVNLKLFLALLLSGFFMRKGWWAKTCC